MRCLVTGATGFIGNNLVAELLERGHSVTVLARSLKKAGVLKREGVSVFEGDLFATGLIEKAMAGCDVVYHLAAYANIWAKDKTLAYHTNVTGTRNILEAAFQNGIKKVVFTSSAATLPHSENEEEVDETFPLPEEYLTDYEATKQQAEQLCVEYCRKGLDVVIVNPTRLYGPGFLNKSNSVTILIKKYMDGTWRIIPGNGSQIGNYVFIGDVVKGHILAMKYGVPGEKYIFGGINVSYNGFFEILSKVSGKNRKLFYMPFPFMLLVSEFEFFMAETFGKKPLITPPWVKRYLQHRPVSSAKAVKNLGYTITPLEQGIEKTIQWLKSK